MDTFMLAIEQARYHPGGWAEPPIRPSDPLWSTSAVVLFLFATSDSGTCIPYPNTYSNLLTQGQGDYDAASPCDHVDLPQTELEPILTRRVVQRGWTLGFSTSFVSLTRPAPDVIISKIRDDVAGATQVIRELAVPLVKKPGQGLLALNVLLNLSHLVANRTGNLHWVFQPEREHPAWGWACIVRMVRPWDEWMFIFLLSPGADVKTI
ncbi:hypothetical protein B0T25DRAFT_574440 [Lasiosphaeria hispida]|uniref:Uncharacterized protein n=1 Tax=Lasiosphaeria hispida TaxID=260671 RepID=A0AAJ0M982_9PEZI|nr:hypothetical protein B0T25DRAFT_574440 [Lasiosphaeria hispida]